MGPAKSAGIACYNACGTCGGFGAPNYYVLFRKLLLYGKTVFLSERNKVQDEQLNDTLVRAVGPYLIGYLSDHYGGFAPPMYLLGGFNVLAGLMIIGALAAHDSNSCPLFVAFDLYSKACISKSCIPGMCDVLCAVFRAHDLTQEHLDEDVGTAPVTTDAKPFDETAV